MKIFGLLISVMFFQVMTGAYSPADLSAATADAGIPAMASAEEFSSPEEAKWYRTFQEGSMLVDGWQEITEELLAKIEPAQKKRQRHILNRLGDRIGREWARDNAVRKIDTDMLRRWGRELRETADREPERLTMVIRKLVETVDSLLGGSNT